QFQKYGMVQGEVLKVGADATESQGAAAVGVEIGRNRIGQSLSYKTIIELGSQELISGSAKYPLNPGMQVAAEIHLGTRTVLEYLLSPVSRAFHEAARER
ncbi:MAG: HlyD family type I secretion periplasmic adaptor subunit, partial [Burkholderiales bacterium]|nr:HlyD family type I secretion periplasmic adaptor subunit [Burkholderiales bacterium]